MRQGQPGALEEQGLQAKVVQLILNPAGVTRQQQALEHDKHHSALQRLHDDVFPLQGSAKAIADAPAAYEAVLSALAYQIIYQQP